MTFESFERPTVAASECGQVCCTTVDEAIDDWRWHLWACVQRMGCHFEHLLQ